MVIFRKEVHKVVGGIENRKGIKQKEERDRIMEEDLIETEGDKVRVSGEN